MDDVLLLLWVVAGATTAAALLRVFWGRRPVQVDERRPPWWVASHVAAPAVLVTAAVTVSWTHHTVSEDELYKAVREGAGQFDGRLGFTRGLGNVSALGLEAAVEESLDRDVILDRGNGEATDTTRAYTYQVKLAGSSDDDPAVCVSVTEHPVEGGISEPGLATSIVTVEPGPCPG